MLHVLTFTLALTTVLVPALAIAADSNVSPALRAQAEALCRDDAVRLCADAIPDEAAILACMGPKRAALKAPCRKVFDEVVDEVRR